jgi:hypothetical protein
MKKVFGIMPILICLAFLSSTSIMAQGGRGGGMGPRTPEELAKAQTARMKEGMTLTTEQEKSVYDINLKFATRMAAARKEAMAAGTRPDTDSVRNWSRQRDSGMKTILTAEQYEKMLKDREENRQRGGQGGGRRGGIR